MSWKAFIYCCYNYLDTGVLLLNVHVLFLQLSNSGQGGSFCRLLRLQGSFLSSCLSSQLVHNLQKVLTTIQYLQPLFHPVNPSPIHACSHPFTCSFIHI